MAVTVAKGKSKQLLQTGANKFVVAWKSLHSKTKQRQQFDNLADAERFYNLVRQFDRNPSMSTSISIPARNITINPSTQTMTFTAPKGTRKRLVGRGIRVGKVRNPPLNPFYEVIVGNIGKVHEGSNYKTALKTYGTYVKQSRSGYGRAAGEDVSLWKNNEPIKEHFGSSKESW